MFERIDGKVVVVSDEVIREYNDMGAFEDAKPIASITLRLIVKYVSGRLCVFFPTGGNMK